MYTLQNTDLASISSPQMHLSRKIALFSLMGILQNMGWSRLEMWGGLSLRSVEARFITKYGVLCICCAYQMIN